MCGIAGIVSTSIPLDETSIVTAINCISYRGPDGSGYKSLNNGQVLLGHRRLSIIDLSDAGKQPMCNEDGSVWLTFNGEIYNFQELRNQLILKGHTFTSHTDSEVLIHGYEEWGVELLPKLNGMFAFAIWDENTRSLLLARDRFGIKPLYYYEHNGQLIFGSELKSFYAFPGFLREIDFSAVIDYLNFYQIPAPKTIWKNTYKIEPASYLKYTAAAGVEIRKFWQISPGNRVIRNEEAVEEVEKLLSDSVKNHLVSDVPVGIFLSSGYDSSGLLGFMKKYKNDINTFSIGFKDSHKTEHVEAAIVARHFQTNHFEMVLEEDFIDVIDDLGSFYDEPYAVSSMVSYYYVSKLAAQHNKVAFAGDGGDEVFAGYKWYNAITALYKNRNLWQKLKHLTIEGRKEFYQCNYFRFMGTNLGWVNRILNRDLRRSYSGNPYWPYELSQKEWMMSPLKVFQLLDYKRFIPDVALPRADKSSMACSLEVRVPFLDHRLVEFMIGLDDNVYFKPGVKKHLLYENIKQMLPEQILRLPKKGFGNPLDNFFLRKETVIERIKAGEMIRSGIFRATIQLNKLTKRQLWVIYNLHLWWSKWFNH